jgi:Zn-dependent peptidase ImmA (M78 family)/DNA-binding XRE family transcriptional regulator
MQHHQYHIPFDDLADVPIGANLILDWTIGSNRIVLMALSKPAGVWLYKGQPKIEWRKPIEFDDDNTPRFVGSLTQIQLAGAAGISQGTLSDLEKGRIAQPSADIVAAIAQATTFPLSFFHLGPLPDFPEGNYRKLKRGTTKAAAQVRAEVRQLAEVVLRAEQLVTLPPVSIEPIKQLNDLEEVENIASEIRAVFRVGQLDPIANMTRAIERSGIVVVPLATEIEDHSDFSAWPDFGLDGRPIIAIRRGYSGDHDRFTLAHEVGHLVLHTRRMKTDHTCAEREVNRFAGALLLPADAARETMPHPITLRVLMAVKAKYGLSIAASAQRALDLGLIGDAHFASLRKQMSTRGWNKEEPVEVATEQPVVIKKVIRVMAGNHGSLRERAERAATPQLILRALVSE